MNELIKALKAVSDETRIRIVKVLLERKSLCVCEIIQALKITQTRASKNLKILKEAGLVTSKKKGLWVHYSINKKMSKERELILEVLGQSINKDAIVIKDRERLEKAVKWGCRK